jgi:hypothetical protein
MYKLWSLLKFGKKNLFFRGEFEFLLILWINFFQTVKLLVPICTKSVPCRHFGGCCPLAIGF